MQQLVLPARRDPRVAATANIENTPNGCTHDCSFCERIQNDAEQKPISELERPFLPARKAPRIPSEADRAQGRRGYLGIDTEP